MFLLPLRVLTQDLDRNSRQSYSTSAAFGFWRIDHQARRSASQGDGVVHRSRQHGPDKLDALGFHAATEERYLKLLNMTRREIVEMQVAQTGSEMLIDYPGGAIDGRLSLALDGPVLFNPS